MSAFLLIFGIAAACVVALVLYYLGIAWLVNAFGQKRVEDFVKMRMQGPFAPTLKSQALNEKNGD